MQKFKTLAGICFLLLALFTTNANAAKREFYEIKIYHIKNTEQGERVENYLKNAFIPAMHRAGFKHVGVFKPVLKDTTSGKQIYVLTTYKALDQLVGLHKTLEKDQKYLADGKDYLDAVYSNPPYERIETTVLQAFEKRPMLKASQLSGAKSDRIYELRSYESHTEKIHRNKVRMFNDGDEMGIFDRLGFNPVFYGEVVSGKTMPNLMYLTTFEHQASRDAHWKAFTNDEEWAKLKVRPEFQNNVSKNIQKFLYPTE